MLRRHFGKVLVVLAVVSLTLGVTGFLRVDPAITVPTALYRTVQLFYWNYFPWNTTTEVTLPWTLEWARWLAPLTTLGALARVTLALFQKRWDEFLAGRQLGHIVVCGAGEKGAALAGDLRARGLRVVVVERDADRADQLSADGLLVVQGDAGRDEVLRRCAVSRARLVVAAGGDDHENLAIAMAATRAGAPEVIAHSGNSALSDLYQRHSALATPEENGGGVRIFNAFRNLARQALAVFPPSANAGEVHIVLPAIEDRALALLVEYALLGHFPGDRRVHVHLAGPQAAADRDRVLARFPGLVHCVHVDILSVPSPEMFASVVADLVNRTPGDFTVFPELLDINAAFRRALELLEFTPGRSTLRILLPAPGESAVAGLVQQNPTLRTRLGLLPTPAEACGYEAVVAEALDRTARAIHEAWLEETRRQIAAARAAGNEAAARAHEAKATFKSWDQLSEEQKGASRSQADHIPFKLRAVGLDPAQATRRQWEELSPDAIEVLARVEHARWAAFYWLNGWTPGAQRDDAAKKHPNLVAYEELDEPTREYDRAAVRNLAHFLPSDRK